MNSSEGNSREGDNAGAWAHRPPITMALAMWKSETEQESLAKVRFGDGVADFVQFALDRIDELVQPVL
jgi:hypothetical protein